MAITGTGTTLNDKFKVTKPGTANTPGSVTIDGNAGLDAVSLYGKFTDFTINVDSNILSVSENTTHDTYQLTSIEKILFSDNKQVSVSPESVVNVVTTGAQTDVTVLTLPALPAFAKVPATGTTPEIPAVPAFDGGFVNFWQGTDGYYFRKFDANGVALTLDQKILAGVTGGIKPALQYVPATDTTAATTNIILAWPAPDGDKSGISVQIFNTDGTAKTDSPTFRANDTITDDQAQPSIAVLTDGSFVVAWTSANQAESLQNGRAMGDTPNQAGVFAQHFDSQGTPLGWEMKISDSGASDAHVTAMDNGDYVISYEGITMSDNQMVINAKLFNSDDQWQYLVDNITNPGNPTPDINTTFESTKATTDPDHNEKASNAKLPTSAKLADGSVVFVWQAPADGYTPSGGGLMVHDDSIIAKIYSPTGVATHVEIHVNTYTTYEQKNPAVAALKDGGFVVVWQSMLQDGSYWGVYGQRFDASGNSVGQEFQVNTKTTDSQQKPTVTGLADGGFVVSWEAQYQDGNQQGIYQAGDAATEIVQQRYDASGVAIGNVFAGGNGNDTITIGGSGNVEIDGGAGDDILTSGSGNDTLRGGAGNDTLNAGEGKNAVIGGDGIDKLMLPGIAKDYTISNISGGYEVKWKKDDTHNIDDYVQGVEKLQFSNNTFQYLSGDMNGVSVESKITAVDVLTGTAANDTLTGGNLNGKPDVLNGLAGDDKYYAIGNQLIINDTSGNDTLVIDNTVTKFKPGNIDLSNPSTNNIKGLENIENVDLSLTGTATIKLTGNDAANILIGNNAGNSISGGAGDDVIYGGLGNDTLLGGDGTDMFVFNTKPDTSTNHDTINDFSGDKIVLDTTVFMGVTTKDAHNNTVLNFIQGDNLKNASGSANAFIVYDSKTGNLYYDPAGSNINAKTKVDSLGPVLITKVGILEPHQTSTTDPATGQTTVTTTNIFHPATLSTADFILW